MIRKKRKIKHPSTMVRIEVMLVPGSTCGEVAKRLGVHAQYLQPYFNQLCKAKKDGLEVISTNPNRYVLRRLMCPLAVHWK